MTSNTLTLSFQIDNVRVGSGGLFLIAGPCVIESEEHALRMAEIIKGVVRSLNFPFIFKASYDKAKSDYDRDLALVDSSAISKQDVDAAHAAF